ncbi:hypothetical protein PENTCL1PPCAC_23496, partial [Pristionchus entomophagus]
MAEFGRKAGSSPRHSRGGGGSRKGRKGGGGGSGNSGFGASPPTEFYNSQYDYAEPPRMPEGMQRKNAWDDHATEHDEQILVAKGLITPSRDRRTPPYEEHRSSDYPPHESSSYSGGGAYDHDSSSSHYQDGDGYGTGYRNGGGGAELPYSTSQQQQQQYRPSSGYDYDVMTPPRSHQSQQDLNRDDDYRSQRSIERETCATIEDEYYGWSSADLNREVTRLQRRLDVVRDMRDRAEEQERRNYSEEQEFIQNVRDGESFYERDEAGYSALGRQAYNTQQKRNEQSRGYIPASRLDRYGPSSTSDYRRSDGGRRRDEDQ